MWRDRLERADGGAVEVRFLGKGEGAADAERWEILAAAEPEAPPLAWARQIHSATLLPEEGDAEAGFLGRGDALFTGRPDVALSVITADCVPALLAAGDRLAGIHAGWRGIVAGIVPAAVERLASPDGSEAPGAPPGDMVAWIGPTIGPCCYEVGEDVAREVAAVSAADVVVPGRRERPHLDLVAAVRHQLAAAGVADVRLLAPCTRCHPEELWSYRREGERAGRNVGFIWRSR